MEKLFEQFKTYLLVEKRVSTNTYEAYSSDIRQFLDFIGQVPETVTIGIIRNFLAILKDQGLSDASLARKMAALKTFYNYAAQFHSIENVAANIMIPKIKAREPRLLHDDEIKKLREVAAHDRSALGLRNQLLVNLLYISGLRVSELTNLLVSDIRIDEKMIVVAPKDGGTGRTIELSQATITLLKDYCATLVNFKKEFLFPVVYKGCERPMTRQACWLVLKKLWKKTGMKKEISSEMLRYSGAHQMLQQPRQNVERQHKHTHLETGYLRVVYDKKHPRS